MEAHRGKGTSEEFVNKELIEASQHCHKWYGKQQYLTDGLVKCVGCLMCVECFWPWLAESTEQALGQNGRTCSAALQ